jgi:hypothetical protein
MGTKLRLILIAVLLVLSVVVDSVYYIVSAMTDGLLMVGVVILAMPLVKKLLNS